MSNPGLPVDLAKARFHLVGIKGTGLSAFAELLRDEGARVGGSDVAEVFYTDAILKRLGIPYTEGFDAAAVPDDVDIVVHSAAYNPDTNPELRAALARGLPVMKYTDALGAFSARFDSSGIAGVHGKTTTTALSGVICRAAGLPARILVGSAVGDFGDRSTLCLGDRFFIAETCEYRRHFLSFHPRRIVLTSVESDHQDYFPTYESIRDAFVEYIDCLSKGGEFIYCADDPGAAEVASLAAIRRPDVVLTPYGETAAGDFKIVELVAASERTRLRLAAFPEAFELCVPGRHIAMDAAAALALTSSLVRIEFGPCGPSGDGWTAERLSAVRAALTAFRGSRRRSEIVGEAAGVLVMDDYAHHPTAIRTTLAGLKAFYPKRRLLVSFMSHTYSRTATLLDDFAGAFSDADLVYLHKIYPSAREAPNAAISGKLLYEKALTHGARAIYIDEPMDAVKRVVADSRWGDLFITMGAGDNWKLGQSVLTELLKRNPESR